MTAAKIDAFGFPESAHALSTNIVNAANHVGFAVQRCAALLRTLGFQLRNATGQDKVSMGDVVSLVELALKALPDPETDCFDPLDKCESDADKIVSIMQANQRSLIALLDAMEVAGCMGSTLDELTEAATTAYGIVTGLTDGQRHWDAFCELIVRRGLSVELIDLGPVFGKRPKVNTPETLRRSKAVQRKIAALSASARDESAARAPTRQPAKRRQVKV